MRLCTLLWVVALMLSVAMPVVAQEEATVSGASAADNADASVDDSDNLEMVEEEIEIEDYLATLSTEELEKICLDRGFELEETGEPLSHGDYVEAARRCLTLEEEMNAILNQHPELAAEIEKEIQRLQDQKVRLEEERAEMLAEKELLEAQLQQAGVDLENFRAQASAVSKKDPSEMSFPELLLESFRQLYERVKQDFLLVAKVTKPAWSGAKQAAEMGWRYSKPTVMQAWRYSKPMVLQLYSEVRKRVHQVLPKQSQSPKEVAAE